jgi:hypothetical protein
LRQHILDTATIIVIGIIILAFGFFFPGVFGGPSAALIGSIPGLLVLLGAVLQWLSDRKSEIREEEMSQERYRTRALEEEREPQSIEDPIVIEVAKKYGGVLTKTILAFETKKTLEDAGEALKKFVEQGEARTFFAGGMTIVDIPSARVHLAGSDRIIVELLIQHGGRANRTQLLRDGRLSIEALDASLKRLEAEGFLNLTQDGALQLSVVS